MLSKVAPWSFIDVSQSSTSLGCNWGHLMNDLQCFARLFCISNAHLWASLGHACNVEQLQLLGPAGTWHGYQAGQEGLPSSLDVAS